MRHFKYYFLIIFIFTSCELEHPQFQKIDTLFLEGVKNNKISGANALIYKDGKIVYNKSFGTKNPITKEKYKSDDIFRIASMTKAVTSLGILILWERGLLKIDDPIEKYIKEFKGIGILDKFYEKDSTYSIKPTKKLITIKHLLTHTSGLGYGFIDENSAIRAIFYKEKSSFMKNGVVGFSSDNVTIGETIKNLAKLPLHHEPGEKWTYGIGIDVLGYLIEIITKKSLNNFFIDEIFKPIEMNDTYFYLPADKKNKLVPVLTKINNEWTFLKENRFDIDYPIKGSKVFYSGGGGLSSTIEDYCKFLSIFLNEGRFKKNQIIQKNTIKLVTEDKLNGIQKNTSWFSDLGHSLAFEVLRPQDIDKNIGGSAGTISWGGYFNTKFFADPKKNIIGILYKQSNSTQGIKDDSLEVHDNFINKKFRKLVFNEF